MKWILVSLRILNESDFLKNTNPLQAKIVYFGAIIVSICAIIYLLYKIFSNK